MIKYNDSALAARDILKWAYDNEIDDKTLLAALMIAIRSMTADSQENSEFLKKAFCNFVDNTKNMQEKFKLEID